MCKDEISGLIWYISTTSSGGQLKYEVEHLLSKLEKRDNDKYKELKSKSTFDIHPIFNLVNGEIEEWEILSDSMKNASH